MHPLTRAREAAGLTKAELGRLAGCKGQMVCMVESGAAKPGVALAIRLASHVGAPPAQLFPGMAGEIAAVVAAVMVGVSVN